MKVGVLAYHKTVLLMEVKRFIAQVRLGGAIDDKTSKSDLVIKLFFAHSNFGEKLTVKKFPYFIKYNAHTSIVRN